jgi:hypothetical protein
MTAQTVGRFFVAIVLGMSMWVTPATGSDAVPTEDCPGYVEHLRSARAYLVQGDRKAAASELRQAQHAIDACARGKADEDKGVANRSRVVIDGTIC